jgi:hypothetical protein
LSAERVVAQMRRDDQLRRHPYDRLCIGWLLGWPARGPIGRNSSARAIDMGASPKTAFCELLHRLGAANLLCMARGFVEYVMVTSKAAGYLRFGIASE